MEASPIINALQHAKQNSETRYSTNGPKDNRSVSNPSTVEPLYGKSNTYAVTPGKRCSKKSTSSRRLQHVILEMYQVNSI